MNRPSFFVDQIWRKSWYLMVNSKTKIEDVILLKGLPELLFLYSFQSRLAARLETARDLNKNKRIE